MLFRSEAQGDRNRLHGHVSLAPPVGWQVLGGFLGALVIVTITFLSLATYSRRVTVTGQVAGDQGVVAITPPRAGTLARIMVREGDVVRAGQPLARIAFDTVAGNSSLEQRRSAAIGAEAQAVAERTRADLASSQAKVAALRSDMRGHQIELDDLATQLTGQQRLVALAQDEMDRANGIAKNGFMSRHDLGVREQTLVERRQALVQLERERATLQAQLAQGAADIQREQADHAAAVAETQRLQGQLAGAAAGDAVQRWIEIVAPVAGQVTAVVRTAGEQVGTDRPLLSLVPAGTRLIAKLVIPAAGVGFVRPGQPVAISLDAFPRETFGTLPARIVYVTAAGLPGQSAAAPTFLADATLGRTAMTAYGTRYALRPGMALTAVVTTRRLSLMRWLLDPLYAVMNR